MTGPGGTEVGRVSIKVVPDTDDFRRELRRELQDVERTESVDIHVNVDTARANAQITRLQAQLATLRDQTLTINVPVNRTISRLNSLANTLSNVVTKAASGLLNTFNDLFSVSAAWIPLLAVIGGSILFIGGALSAGFAGLPVLLASIVAPIGALALGFDGVKKAAQQLSPEIDRLKQRLSATFQAELTPIFAELRRLFPIISDGMHDIARSTSDFIGELVKVSTTQRNMDNLRVALAGVNDMLDALTPGVARFVNSLFNISGVQGLYTQLGETIGGVFEQISRFFDTQFGSGELLKSLRNVDTLIENLVRLFLDLLIGAQKFFNAATPGMDAFFQGINNFVNSIDWVELGRIFGETFGAIGTAFDNIDTTQLAFLVQGFENIGLAVQQLVSGKSFEIIISLLRVLLDLISLAIFVVNGLAGALAGLGDAALKVGEVLQGMVSGAFEAFVLVEGFIRSIPERARQLLSGIGESLKDRGRELISGLFGGAIEEWMSAIRFFRDMPFVVAAFFAGSGKWLLSAGRRIIQGFIAGIRQAIPGVKQVLQGLTFLIPTWKGPGDVDARLLVENGELIMQGLNAGLIEGFQGTQRLLSGMTSDLSSAFTDPALINTTTSLGADITGSASSQLNVAGRVDGLEASVVSALSGWDFVIDPTGIARLVNRGNRQLGRR